MTAGEGGGEGDEDTFLLRWTLMQVKQQYEACDHTRTHTL